MKPSPYFFTHLVEWHFVTKSFFCLATGASTPAVRSFTMQKRLALICATESMWLCWRGEVGEEQGYGPPPPIPPARLNKPVGNNGVLNWFI